MTSLGFANGLTLLLWVAPGAVGFANAQTSSTVATQVPASEAASASETEESEPAKLDQEAFPGDPFGDGAKGIDGGPLSFRVLLQTRYATTFATKSTNLRPGFAVGENYLVYDNDGWRLERLFLRIGAELTPDVGFKAIIDFAQLSGKVSGAVKQAFATFRPMPKHFEIGVGIMKLPFSILELDPRSQYELTDLGPANDLIKDLGYGGRDVGAAVMVAPLSKPKHLRFQAGVYRGNSKDEHASPLGAVGGRVESRPHKGLRLGVSTAVKPFAVTYQRPFETSGKDELPMPPDPLYPRAKHEGSGKAFSADITFKHKGAMVRGEAMLGDRTDLDSRYGANTFWAVWGLAAYRFRAGSLRLVPALRAEWFDSDREHSVGLRRVLTAGVSCIFSKRVRLIVDVARSDVQAGSPLLEQPRPLPGFPYFELNNTRIIAQLQVEI